VANDEDKGQPLTVSGPFSIDERTVMLLLAPLPEFMPSPSESTENSKTSGGLDDEDTCTHDVESLTLPQSLRKYGGSVKAKEQRQSSLDRDCRREGFGTEAP